MYIPIGGTPCDMYKYLVKYYKAGQISFKYVKTFNMDEYVGKYAAALYIYTWVPLVQYTTRIYFIAFQFTELDS